MIDSVKKAFILSAKAVKLFYVIAAFNIIANIINLLTVPAPGETEISLGKSFLVIALTLLFSLIAIFITSGALAYIKELIKTGSANLASFIDNAKKYFLRLLGVTLVILAVFLIFGILLSIVLGFIQVALRTILMVIIFIALIVFLIMSPYALVGKELGVIESIKNAILIAKKSFLKVLGIIAIMFGVAIVIMIAASIITGILTFILRPISGFITAVIMAIASAVLTILWNIAVMDFYLKSTESTQS